MTSLYLPHLDAEAAELPNVSFHACAANAAWLESILAATDLIAETRLIGFTEHPDLARCDTER